MTVLAACAAPAAPATTGDSGDAAAGDSPASEPAVSDANPLWVVHKKDYHPDYNDFIRAYIEEYTAEKNWPLEVAFSAGFLAGGATIQQMAAASAADDAPDVWMHDENVVFQLQSLGVLLPVTELAKEMVDKYGNLAPLMRNRAQIGGEWFAVSFHERVSGGYARQDLFEEAGIDIQSVRTYNDLRDACMEISDPENEMWGWGMTINRSGDGNGLIMRVLQGWGATWTDETGNEITIDSPEAVEAINWLVETYTDPSWDRMLPPGVLSWTDGSNNESYLGSKIGYTQNAGTVLAKAYFDENAVAELTAYHPQCGGPVNQEFHGMDGMRFMKIKGGKNSDAADEMIRSFFTDEVFQSVYENARSYAIPAYESMWDWPIIVDTPQSIAAKPAAMDESAHNGLAWPGPDSAHMNAVASANIMADMVASVVTGDATPEAAVKTAAERTQVIFDEFGVG